MSALQAFLRGVPLSGEQWRRRHLTLTALAALHLPAFAVMASRSHGLSAFAAEFVSIGALLAVAIAPLAPRRVRTFATTFALLLTSATLVHLTGGVTESHFHFFVAIGVLSLYRDHVAYLTGVVLTQAHIVYHGLVGPPALVEAPVEAVASYSLQWAAIHAAFVAVAAAVHLVNWTVEARAVHAVAVVRDRERHALALNDTVVQHVALARAAEQLRDWDLVSEALTEAAEASSALVAELLSEPLLPGQMRVVAPGPVLPASPLRAGDGAVPSI